MIRNIFWDVDGTLFDTSPAITYAISKTLSDTGVTIALNVIDGLTRRSFTYCMQYLAQRFNLNPVLLRRKFKNFYRTISPVNQPPFPMVEDLCYFIQNRGGLNIAIAHREAESIQQLFTIHGLDILFKDIIYKNQDFNNKPRPKILLDALEQHSLKPTETLLVGDREMDIQTGQAAGIRTCLFGQAGLSTSADFHVDHYSQLLKVLQEENR